MTGRVLAIAVLAALAAAAPAAAQSPGARIVDLAKSTTVREYDGWLLYSRWDGSAYHLSTWHDGTQTDLPAPRSPGRTTRTPAPTRAASRPRWCPSATRRCDLFVIGFKPGDRLRPVNNANTTDHDEIAPSVWKGRLVFGRRYSGTRSSRTRS